MRRSWAIVGTLSLALAGCAQSEAEQTLLMPSAEQEAAFQTCIEEGGYSLDDLKPSGEPLTPDEQRALGLEVEEGAEVYAVDDIDWDLEFWKGQCMNQSGVGESVVGDPETNAKVTEQSLELTNCMRDRGWDEFPDPQPNPSPYDDGLIHARIDIPNDPEEREAFIADFSHCSDVVGVPTYSD